MQSGERTFQFKRLDKGGYQNVAQRTTQDHRDAASGQFRHQFHQMRISSADLMSSTAQAETPGLSSEETLQAESLEGAVQQLTCADRRVQHRDTASASIFDETTVQCMPAQDGDGSADVAPAVEAELDAMRGGGAPLDQETRAFMEPRFGHDFSQVRIHTDARAATVARSLDALAFT
ncbi:DUF4157 domain-containing protein, partial [Roseiflexus sp.]|uniref:eCIS core domain-containing protein n=1 Tax=Roseiflexus sp. TaxID=2562120 RepID=UPI00398A85F3